MAGNDLSKLKKTDLLERISKKLSKLPKDQLLALATDVEAGELDFTELARQAQDRLSGDKPVWGFQDRFRGETENEEGSSAEAAAGGER